MTGHIFIEGEIGYDVNAKTVRADIANYPQAKDWLVHINSGGGDVYEGYQICAILKGLGAKKKAAIGSMCASITTAIAMSCDTVTMSPQGDFMIHLPTAGMEGTAEDLRKGAEQLDRIKNELINLYMPRVSRKGITREQLSTMIEQETSMSPSEALQMGFVDEVEQPLKAVAKFKINMENTLTKEQAEGMFTEFGKRIDTLFTNLKKSFKNAVQLAMADGSMVTSDAPDADSLVGSVITGPQGVLADGPYETADGFILVITGGKVESYGPKTEDKADANKENEALKSENAALKEQLLAATNATKAAVDEKTKLEAKVSTEFKNLQTELEEMKSKTFGDGNPPPGRKPNDKLNTNEGTEEFTSDPTVLAGFGDYEQAFKDRAPHLFTNKKKS